MTKYIHSPRVHNTKAAEIIIPILLTILPFKPKKIVDIGCGLGTWLKVFADMGNFEITGYEGNHLDRSLLTIPQEKVIIHDLEKPINVTERHDLAISLEVAEHLSPANANIFIESLVNLSDTVLFSAAIVGQGGQNHLNECEPEYWKEKFEAHGYFCYDIIRNLIWENENIEYWYRQNIFIYAKKGVFNIIPTEKAHMYVHPNMYLEVLNQRNRLAKISGYNTWKKIKAKFNGESFSN